MSELNAILRLWRESRGQDPILATVVRVAGSAYRRPGARMLLLRDGRSAGSISGGCLEGDLRERAWRVTENGPAIHTYNTMPEEDAIFGHGLGCQGIVDVLLERAENGALDVMNLLAERREAAVATVISSQWADARLGDRLLVDGDGVWRGALRDSAIAPELAACAAEVIYGRRKRLVHAAGCEVFVERLGPPARLVILGAGYDAIPLASLAAGLGWHVTVCDTRAIHVHPDRFPQADRVMLLDSYDDVENLGIGPASAVVLMTHNYGHDAHLLQRLQPLHPAYLGLLGPRARTQRLLAESGIEGTPTNLHSPAGLDIGGESPESIALSIVAEIQAVLAGRGGGMLKYRRGSLHAEALEPAEALQ